jgi:2-polyprenyl-3-methyl-5-hydroxy-6-metoxy-1,4-benzoquinol methylase
MSLVVLAISGMPSLPTAPPHPYHIFDGSMKVQANIAALQAAILAETIGDLRQNSRVLDIGCGNGDVVQGWLDLGFDAAGCDFRFKPGARVESLRQAGGISLIAPEPYRLPYDDASFDIVVTNQVMEHVGTTRQHLWRCVAF